jgi:hypothetical protein
VDGSPTEPSDLANDFYARAVRSIFDDDPLPPYASLSQPTPLSILHLPRPGGGLGLTDDIYVAGRFTSILHYDRRKFPSIVGSVYSGASLSGLACLPYPFSTLDSELRRRGELSAGQITRSKTLEGGCTLIACGEYNTKGSLELYGLRVGGSSCSSDGTSNKRGTSDLGSGASSMITQQSTMKNRQTSAQSKILSVINHGTRLAFSDSSGNIKWFERDGFTEVRRHKIGHSEVARQPSIFASMPGSDDLARKILSTGANGNEDYDDGGAGFNNDDIIFWTGEKLGLLGFSAKPGFSSEDFDDADGHPAQDRTVEAEREAAAERAYSEHMRRALARQAEDVRFVRNLGYGAD